jgi:hypothetical protein
MCPGVDSASKNENQFNSGGKGGRCVRLTTYHLHVPMSRNLGALTFWNLVGLFRPVMGQFYLHLYYYFLLSSLSSVVSLLTQPHIQLLHVLSRGQSGRGMRLTTHLHTLPRLGISGAKPLFVVRLHCSVMDIFMHLLAEPFLTTSCSLATHNTT